MKKNAKKLTLARETVRALEHPELVAGGEPQTIRISCNQYNCTLGTAAPGCNSSLC
jgi:hypothetical protein